MSVSCTINIQELTDVLAVPINAVQITDKKYVITVENGETKEVSIETGLSNDEYVEVKSGLFPRRNSTSYNLQQNKIQLEVKITVKMESLICLQWIEVKGWTLIWISNL